MQAQRRDGREDGFPGRKKSIHRGRGGRGLARLKKLPVLFMCCGSHTHKGRRWLVREKPCMMRKNFLTFLPIGSVLSWI